MSRRRMALCPPTTLTPNPTQRAVIHANQGWDRRGNTARSSARSALPPRAASTDAQTSQLHTQGSARRAHAHTRFKSKSPRPESLNTSVAWDKGARLNQHARSA